MAACLGSIDPSAFDNYSFRLEHIGKIGVQTDAVGWAFVDRNEEYLMGKESGTGLSVAFFEPPAANRGLLSFIRIAPGMDRGTIVETKHWLLVSAEFCCGSGATIIGQSLSLAAGNMGQPVGNAVLPTPMHVGGVVFFDGESLVAFQTEGQDAGLALFELTSTGQFEFIGVRHDEAFAGVHGGRMLMGTDRRIGYAVGNDRLIAFEIDDEHELIVHAVQPLRAGDDADVFYASSGGGHGDVAFYGAAAWVTDTGRGLFSVDIADPTAPKPQAVLSDLPQAQGMAILDEDNGFLVVTMGINGVGLINVSEPSEPRLLNVSRTENVTQLVARPPHVYAGGSRTVSAFRLFGADEY